MNTIPDGFYQVIMDGNTNFIFRIRTHGADEKVRPGQQIIALAKHFGSRTFTSFGVIREGSIAFQFRRWKRQEYNDAVLTAAKLVMGDTETAGQLYARSFGRCYVCNRPLTDPHSLATGIGPDCAGTRKHVEVDDKTPQTLWSEICSPEAINPRA